MSLRSAAGVGLLLISAACGSVRASGTATDGGQVGASTSCATDDDCIAKLPVTTPAGCATGICGPGGCVWSAKDEDGDGHTAATCSAANGAAIVTGDDCNDHDPHLYPGHPEACDTLPDGGSVAGDLCAAGARSCLADGSVSSCIGALVCTASACVDQRCVGSCVPGQARCASNGVETCGSDGIFGTASPCVEETCIGSGTTAKCEGTCAPGTRACSGAQPERCVGGTWQGEGAACSGASPTCSAGACVVCAPGAGSCDGTQPRACSSDGSGWTDVGADCAASGQACVAGRCVACAPGALGCSGEQPQICDAEGSWGPNGDACVDAVCADGVCTGTCSTGQTRCSGDALSTCDATGTWGAATSCPSAEAACCGNGCTDVTTDAYNCGTCGAACNGGPSGACGYGLCSYVLATGTNDAEGIAVDATSVYWTNRGGGTVMKVPTGGGAPTTLASGQSAPLGIVVNASRVYWVDSGNPGAVMSVSTSGGMPVTLASNQDGPEELAVDATHVYWTTSGGGTVVSVPLDGGAAVTLATAQDGPAGIAVDATSVYWTNFIGGEVMSVPLGGGLPTTLASGRRWPARVAVDGSGLYWTENDIQGGVITTSLGGGTVVTLVAPYPGPGIHSLAIVLDPPNFYWTDTPTITASASRVPLAGGAITPVAWTPYEMTAIAIDAASIYWPTTGTDGTIMKAPK